jgi:lipopolysaccharide export system permease protein|tara:strand:+ start:1036 stop:2217 length:1182 start_codon:yes stop_codon:yes gene_type:complete
MSGIYELNYQISMKKIMFRKFALDCTFFFLISIISASTIVWVFQAVNFLDLMVEDGRDFFLYLNYTFLNFPKIVSKLLPFALFFSFFYVISKYELNNELIIFWNFGISKIQLINFVLKVSLFFMVLQILLVALIVPKTQNISRDLIKKSNVNFFESFIKPRKFNDNIKGLTIFADEKNDKGELKNIYLKKETEDNNFQITYAKKGYFQSSKNVQILVLENGQTINKINDDITTFNFKESTLNMSSQDSSIIKVDKIQETSTYNLILCLDRFINFEDKTKKKSSKFIQNCTSENLDNVFKEVYKRFLVPVYIPTLILVSLILIIKSKETINYTRYRLFIFLLGVGLIIFSETTQKFIINSLEYNIAIFIMPIIIFIIFYFLIFYKINFNHKNNN